MLSHLGPQFPPSEHPELLVGLARPDDAAVYAIDDERALVQTLDFFAPLVDDPYQFGAIAAANAMSDVYAMGGRVLFALNIAAFPEDLPPEVIADVLRGGADKVREAGAVVAGGHTIIDEEPKFGLAVTGEVARDLIRTTGGAQPGDTIILTKEIGTGVLIGANQQGAVSEEHWNAAVAQMMTLNRDAAEAASDPDLAAGVHAIADVTGFGLAGHLHEMAELSDAAIEIDLGAAPALGGLAEAVVAGFGSGGQGTQPRVLRHTSDHRGRPRTHRLRGSPALRPPNFRRPADRRRHHRGPAPDPRTPTTRRRRNPRRASHRTRQRRPPQCQTDGEAACLT